jgi:uncharacterized protein (TIGR00369 family)
MDADQLKGMLSQVVPFNRHLGLEVLDVGEGMATVRLPEEPHLLNHVGTQHAGALFGVAEAASGGAMLGAFSDLVGKVTPLARRAEIVYLKPARGPITASAALAEEQDAIRTRLEADGKSDFPVKVSLEDGAGLVVAEVTVSWHLRANSA